MSFGKMISDIAVTSSGREVFDAFVTTLAFGEASLGAPINDCGWLAGRGKQLLQSLTDEEAARLPDLGLAMADEYRKNPNQDLLGEAYMELDLGDNRKGQYFTPYGVSKMMASMTLDREGCSKAVESNGFVSVCDPCAGSGSMLISAANRLSELGIRYQDHAVFVAQELDTLIALVCYAQLCVIGVPGVVRIGNSLTEDFHCELMTPRLYSNPFLMSRLLVGMDRAAAAS